jgi:hypothetical protein
MKSSRHHGVPPAWQAASAASGAKAAGREQQRMTERIVIPLIALMLAVTPVACGNSDVRGISGPSGVAQSMDRENRGTEDPGMKRLDGQQYRADEIVVKFAPGVDKESVERIAGRQGLTIVRRIAPDLYLCRISEGPSVAEVIQRLKAVKEVEYSEPNYTRK